jgi:hypothetical protein
MRAFIFSASLLLAAAAPSQTCFYIPDNQAAVGTCNVIPFGDSNPMSATWANQKYQMLVTAAQLNNMRGKICELGFAPCGSGLRQFATLKIQLSHTTVTTLSTTFASNLPNPVTVLDTTGYFWTNVMNTWNRIGLQRSFDYNGTDNVVIDIELTGVGLPGGTNGMHRGALQRVFATSWTGTPPLTGSTDMAATKVEVCMDAPDLWTYGKGCVGSNSQTPTLTYAGSAQLANVFSVMLSGALPTVPAILATGFNNSVFGPVQLPWDMAPSGAPGCNLFVSPVIFGSSPTDANGNATLRFGVPLDLSLICGRAYHQWFPLDRAQNPLGLTASDYGRVLVGS